MPPKKNYADTKRGKRALKAVQKKLLREQKEKKKKERKALWQKGLCRGPDGVITTFPEVGKFGAPRAVADGRRAAGKAAKRNEMKTDDERLQDTCGLKNIFDSYESSDVEVACGEIVFKCHKSVLSAKSVRFKDMFTGDNPHNPISKISADHVGEEAVEEMLKYIYAGEMSNIANKLDEDLLVLAARYLPNTLQVTCGDAILKRLNISNCISCFIIADRFFLPDSKLRKMLDLYTRCKAEQKGRP